MFRFGDSKTSVTAQVKNPNEGEKDGKVGGQPGKWRVREEGGGENERRVVERKEKTRLRGEGKVGARGGRESKNL
ncbi:hypothetical protein RUM44_000324 [Polyplax serrata]|uniref:Uncharacterized protein n=1 Tax=Polyplax serrata TaxID=468196 RepID=A0ABR1B543_POLSC